jgi:protein-tyrosine phosphatase
MAEALLRAKLPSGCGIGVASAGTIADGTPPPEPAVQVMAVLGLDIEGRPSRRVDVGALEEADLIIAMTRQHLLEVATMNQAALERSFTLVDLIKRAQRVGGPAADESLSQWARRLSAGRTQRSVLSLPTSEDIVDPMGRSLNSYRKVAKAIDHLTDELAARLFGSGSPPWA